MFNTAKGMVLVMALIFNAVMLILLMGSFEITLNLMKEHRIYMKFFDELIREEKKEMPNDSESLG